MHLIVSRSASGSSVRFVAAFACAYLAAHPPSALPMTPSGSHDKLAALIHSAWSSHKRARSSDQSSALLPTSRPSTARRVLLPVCTCRVCCTVELEVFSSGACVAHMQPLTGSSAIASRPSGIVLQSDSWCSILWHEWLTL